MRRFSQGGWRFTYLNNGPYEELQYHLPWKFNEFKNFGGGQWCIQPQYRRISKFCMYLVVSRCLRRYKVQDVLVYMPPTITYIYGLKKHLFVLISSTTTKSPNVARVGTGCTVKYLSFCQDFRTPNRFLAKKGFIDYSIELYLGCAAKPPTKIF